MSKLRTLEQLSDALDGELAWRKVEIRDLRMQVEHPFRARKGTALRTAIALGYAHLEGYFKAAATDYLEYLANQTVPLAQLHVTHQARSLAYLLRKQYSGAVPTEPTRLLQEGLTLLEGSASLSAKLPYKGEVRTHSNLNSAVLRALLVEVGLREDLFTLKEKQLDAGLLKSRNSVAHGQYIEADCSEVVAWLDMVLEMCDLLTAELLKCATLESWRRRASQSSSS